MIRFGAKRKQHMQKMIKCEHVHATPCHVCGAAGVEPCISKVDGKKLKRGHVGRKK